MNLVKQKIAFQQHIDQLAVAMVTRDKGRHGTRTVLLFTLFFGDEISIFNSAAEFDARIGKFAQRLRAAGMIDLRGRVLDCVQDDTNRFHCKVEWIIETRLSGWFPTCMGYHYMTDPGDNFKVHMVAYEDQPNPLAFDWVTAQKLFEAAHSPFDLVKKNPSLDLHKFGTLVQDVVNAIPHKVETAISETQAKHYVLPLTVFFEKQISVFENKDMLNANRANISARFKAIGITSIQRHITHVEIQDDNRFTAQGHWEFITTLGQRKYLADGCFHEQIPALISKSTLSI